MSLRRTFIRTDISSFAKTCPHGTEKQEKMSAQIIVNMRLKKKKRINYLFLSCWRTGYFLFFL